MKSISYFEFFQTIGGYNRDWLVDVILAHRIPYFTVRSDTLKSAGLECGAKIKSIGWNLDKTTAIYSNETDQVICIVFNMEDKRLVDLFLRTKKLKAFI